MGIELEPAIPTVLEEKNYCVNDFGIFQNRQHKEGTKNIRFGFHEFQEFPVEEVMDRGRGNNPYNPSNSIEESIKNTMQMHEEIFKQQVRELHRLYSVQKLLMREVRKQIEHTGLWSSLTSSSETNFINQSLQIQSIDLERPFKEEVAIDGSEPRNCFDSGFVEEDDVELTLSIGRKMESKYSKNKLIDSSLLTESDKGGWVPDNSGGSETDTSSKSNRERKQPPWFFQV